MTHIAITAADLPARGCPRTRPFCTCSAQGSQCRVHIEAAVLDRLMAMRRPRESYSDIILRLVELQTSDLE